VPTGSPCDTLLVVRPLLLTGPPASGKSTTARALAGSLPLAAVIDVDDIRQLVVAGHAAPWQGEAGRRQQRLGVENACDLAGRFVQAGIDVVVADVVTPATAQIYRSRQSDLLVVGLRISFAEAARRATLRPFHLSGEEFRMLHQEQAHLDLADHVIDVDDLDLVAQVAAVRRLW
jgi:energy-coupling factor transporter ATP-binding protein EcfA2